MNKTHYLSRIFQPTTVLSKTSNITRQDVTSKSQRLMLELGIIRQSCPGCFHLLPLGLKSLNKLINLVDSEMIKIGAQKVSFPTLTNSKLWKSSGRYVDMKPELLTLKDRHEQEYIVSPTHEEVASDLLSTIFPISYKNFPLKLYQISAKFRDEMKPRFGLIRSREFLMKDLYSFDLDQESAMTTYESICGSYERIFTKIGVDFVKVLGMSGDMGGDLSHEYHFISDIGEVKIASCKKCGHSANVQLFKSDSCPKCNGVEISTQTGIEVGHTFLLGDKYSRPLHARYLNKNSKPELLQMGSYGLGLSRILAASVEVLCSEQEMRWPDILAPYNVVVLPPKKGSKEEKLTEGLAEKISGSIQENVPELKENVLVDDRIIYTIGRRQLDARRVGYRFIVVINNKSAEKPPIFEVNDIKNDLKLYLSENELCRHLRENIKL